MHVGLDEKGQMGVGAQAPIGHEHVTWLSGRMDRLHPGKIVGEEGRDDQLPEHTGASMEQPHEPGDGKAAPRPRLCRLAECVL